MYKHKVILKLERTFLVSPLEHVFFSLQAGSPNKATSYGYHGIPMTNKKQQSLLEGLYQCYFHRL